MRFLFHEAAEAELDHAAAYYESCKPGLGIAFAEEVFATIGVISAHPEVGTPISRNTRRFLVKRFPFGVIYQSKGSALRIIAVADLRRRPGYWEDRLGSSAGE